MRKIKPKSDKQMMEGPSEVSSEKKYYPRLRIELVHLPEAKKWKLEKEYTIALKVKMTGLSISRFQNDAEFDIMAIDPDVKADDSTEEKEEE